MKPEHLKTRIFLDGGDPDETKKVIDLLGFLDGQTTNPTLISKNPVARQRIERGEKFSREEIFEFYRQVVEKIADIIPQGSISIEVYADAFTTCEEMIKQGKEMFSWIPNAHIKFPITHEGLKAAGKSIKDGLRVNMTLCFTQEQAAAVYAATEGGKKGEVFISPFVGRLDDRGENGMDLISNIIKMYQKEDSRVEVLTASVRNIDHLLYALKLESDIVTAPFKILKEWSEKGLLIPVNEYTYNTKSLKGIPFKDFDLNKKWQDYNLYHELTDKGVESFSSDWNDLIQ